MGRMVRKQIVLDAEMERELAARAEVLGLSQSELVRRAIGRYLHPPGGGSHRAQSMERLRDMWEQAEQMSTGSGGRRWTREEIHERPGDARRERAGVRRGHE